MGNVRSALLEPCSGGCHLGSNFLVKYGWPQEGSVKVINSVVDPDADESSWGVAESLLSWKLEKQIVEFSFVDEDGYNLRTKEKGRVMSTPFVFLVDAFTMKYVGTNTFESEDYEVTRWRLLKKDVDWKDLTEDAQQQLISYVQMFPPMLWETWTLPYMMYQFRDITASPHQKSNIFYKEESIFDDMLIGHQHSFQNFCRMQMVNNKITKIKPRKRLQVEYDEQLQRCSWAMRVSSCLLRCEDIEEKVIEGRIWVFQWVNEVSSIRVAEIIEKCDLMMKN